MSELSKIGQYIENKYKYFVSEMICDPASSDSEKRCKVPGMVYLPPDVEVTLRPFKNYTIINGVTVNLITAMEDNGLDPANFGKNQGLRGLTWLMVAAHVLGLQKDRGLEMTIEDLSDEQLEKLQDVADKIQEANEIPGPQQILQA